MGNQQLLLIALGVFIVVIAIFIGFKLFTASFNEQIKDLAIVKVNDIGIQANVYRKKSSDLGGGGGSYKGFSKQLHTLLKEYDIVKKIKFTEQINTIVMNFTLTTKGENNRAYRVWGRYTPNGLDRLRVYEPDQKKWIWLYK